jgi:hypothetical protein
MERICLHCNIDFEPRRLNQFYCRQSCRQGAYLLRKGFQNNNGVHRTNPSQSVNDGFDGLYNSHVKPMRKSCDSDVIPVRFESENDAKVLSETSKIKNPSQNVNDGFSKRQKSDDDFMEDSWRNHGSKKDDSWKHHGRFMEESWRVHGKTVGSSEQELVNSALNQVNSDVSQSQNSSHDVFLEMVERGLTLSIPPSGYVRSLFPHWENKQWHISVFANRKMLGLFEKLQKASIKNVISFDELTDTSEKIRELCDGFYGFCLPEDYPFTAFLRLMTDKLTSLTDKAIGKKEIRFKISDELFAQMTVLKIQIGE